MATEQQPPPPPATQTASPIRVAILVNDDAPQWAGETERLWRDTIAGTGAACDGDDADADDGGADEPRHANTTTFAFTDFDCAGKGEVPTADELCANFDAVVVGGSRFSVYGPGGPAEEQGGWLEREAAALAAAARRPDGPRILGACFGAQLLGKALGGEVGPNPGGRFVLGVEREVCLVVGGEESEVARALREELLLSERRRRRPGGDGDDDDEDGPPKTTTKYRLLQSHGDQVLRLPPGARPLLSSPTARHELWSAEGGRVLCAQGHAEFGRAAALARILPALRASGRLTEQEAEAAEASLTDRESRPDSAALRAVMRRFLAGEFGVEGGGKVAAAAAAAAGASEPPQQRAAAAASPPPPPPPPPAPLQAAADALSRELSAALAARSASLVSDYRALDAADRAAAAAVSKAADVAGALASFADVLGGRRAQPVAAAGAALARLPRALDALEARVAALEAAGGRVEARLRAKAQQRQQEQEQERWRPQQQQQEARGAGAGGGAAGRRRSGGGVGAAPAAAPLPPAAAAAASSSSTSTGSFLRRLGLM